MNSRELIITYEIAEIAKEKGYTNELGLSPLACDVTYYELIKWIFNNIKDDNPNEASIRYDSKYLKYWYNILKDCPLKYEFRGRLLEWFRSKGYRIFESLIVASAAGNMFGFRVVIGKEKLDIYSYSEKTYEEALEKAILRIFKLMKHE